MVKGDPKAPQQVGLDPQPMVDWLSPTELARAALKAVLATTFGNYADKREVQAALSPGGVRVAHDYSKDREVWFDYIADLGDGFNPTYAMSWLLARQSLNVYRQVTESQPLHVLPEGRFVVFGGDQVYPTATRDAYRTRFIDPMAVAFRTTHPQAPPNTVRDMFAVPGNHDWYDGLTSFSRLFCQQRSLGPLQTHQQRSYFALRLPHNWWLWGIDIQLSADVDDPQKKFFQELLAQMTQDPGPRPQLILCTAEPSWVLCGDESQRKRDTLRADPAKHATLSYFERLAAGKNVRVALTLSGDLHHFAHYVPDDAAQPHRVSAGGGGAFLCATHHLPQRLKVPVGVTPDLWSGKNDADTTSSYALKTAYPPADESRRMVRGVLKLPFAHLTFACVLGALYLLFAWIVQIASRSINGVFANLSVTSNDSLMELLADLRLPDLITASSAFFEVLRHSPASIAIALLVVFALWRYRASEGVSGTWGLVHGVMHVILSFFLIWIFSWLNLGLLNRDVNGLSFVALFTVEMLFAGGVVGGFLFAIYFLISGQRSGIHLEHVFSSQAIQDFKSFLRIHIRPDGELEIYPIGVPRVPRDDGWRATAGKGLEPAEGDIKTTLIGGAPIRVGAAQHA